MDRKEQKKNAAEDSDLELDVEDIEYLKKYRVKYDNVLEIEKDSILPHLTQDIWSYILAKVPPDHLYQDLRFICKEWKAMMSRTDLVQRNFAQCTKSDFLVQEIFSWKKRLYKVYRMEIDEEKLNCKLHAFGKMGKVRSSCYGMLLTKCPKEQKQSLRVLNVVTQCCLTLPKCPSDCLHKRCGVSLTYDTRKNLLKVVHIYADGFGFEIFTIGDSSNAWKRIPGPWEDQTDRPPKLLDKGWSDPVSINGRFLYWDVQSSDYIISMDVTNEKSVKTQLPRNVQRDRYVLLELVGQLSLVDYISDTQINIWILDDFHNKIWFKKHIIDLKTIKSRLRALGCLTPIAGTSNGVFVFTHKSTKMDGRLYICDTENKKMRKVKNKVLEDNVIVHRSSIFNLQQSSLPT